MNYQDLERAYQLAMTGEIGPSLIVFSLNNPPMFIVDAVIADLDEDFS